MAWMRTGGTSLWKLCRWSDCGECHPASRLDNPIRTRLWMDQQSDPLLMQHMRRALFTETGVHSHMMEDGDVASVMSHQISSRMLHVCEKEVPLLLQRTDGHAVAHAEVESAPVERSTRSSSTPAPKAAEPPSFGREADLAAMAGVLKAAAETGTPFCEECAKAAAAGGQ